MGGDVLSSNLMNQSHTQLLDQYNHSPYGKESVNYNIGATFDIKQRSFTTFDTNQGGQDQTVLGLPPIFSNPNREIEALM